MADSGSMLNDVYQGIATWLVPPVLGFAIHYLQQISNKLGKISESLAIVVTKIDSHEKRLTALEKHLQSRLCKQ